MTDEILADFRSDTVTLPTEAMIRSIETAPLGDDSRDGDPTVERLESMAAEMTGKEAGLLVSSGTMGNLLALMAHGDRGGEVLVDDRAHMLNSEMGGIAGIAGLMYRPIRSAAGMMDLKVLRRELKSSLAPKHLKTSILWMENTHNSCGGVALSVDYMSEVAAFARSVNAAVHLDGARLFNAAIALGVSAAELAAHADSVMFCLSKGLSAPIGSLLVGSEAFVVRARALRRMIGGNLRQGGVIAAPGICALETMVERLEEDHRTARQLALGFAAINPSFVDLDTVQTNMVLFDVGDPEDLPVWQEKFKEQGILVLPSGPQHLRFMTHRHITLEIVEEALERLRKITPGR